MSEKRPAGLLFIFITLLLDVLGIGLIIPILPRLVEGFVQNDVSVASRYLGVLISVYAFVQFLCAPVLGSLSDQYGRRPVILISLLGFGLDYLLLAFAPSLGWLFAGRVIAGITGSSATTASAYIADVSPPEKRAQNFGLIGAAFGLGFIIGPALGGVLGGIHVRLPFFAAAGLTLLNWLYGFFILPESLAKENRRKFSWRRANPVAALVKLGKYPVILGLTGSLICLNLAGQIHPSTWVLFTTRQFRWSEVDVGLSLAFVGLLVALVQGLLTRIIIPRIGDRRAVITGLLLYAFGFVLFGFASRGWMMYAAVVPFALGGIAGPAIQGLISRQVGPSEQGELQGALTSLASLTAIVGPLLATNLFAYFNAPAAPVHLPGAAFLMGTLLTLAGLLIALRSFPRTPVVAAEATVES
ncbi:MAG: TCR/Tet family MFS transporter [Ferruginibacter sp.]|nr:TCR/Tet family MFS transporter [Cytophagales bacterium]